MSKIQFFVAISLVLFFVTNEARGQGIGSVFRAGLTYSKLSGPVLMDDIGSELERLGMVSGFHLGAGLRYKFDYAEQYGIGFEVVYTQKGGRTEYNGPSYFVLRSPDSPTRVLNGTRTSTLDISTSHFDFPLTLFGKFFNKLELHGGLYASFLLRAEGGGNFSFKTNTPNDIDFTVFWDQNFRNDNIPDISAPISGETIEVRVLGDRYLLPKTQGAYFEHVEKTRNLFRYIDYGLIGGVSFFLTRGLYLGGRFQYGLSNQVNNDMFISLRDIEGTTPLLREDSRRNISYQVALGFAF